MTLNVEFSKQFTDKQLFKFKAPDRDGLILQLLHTSRYGGTKQIVRFSNACFDHMGLLLAAVNQKGDVLVMDMVNSKYWTTTTINSCSIIKFSPLNDSEIIIGGSNGLLHILNIDTSKIIAELDGHKFSVAHISFSKDFYCLTGSLYEAILWDLKNNTRLQILNVAENASIKQIFFMPVTNYVFACFHDDTMQVWQYGTFEAYKQILPSSWHKSVIKCLAITRNGRAMVVGGNTSHMAIFLLDIWEYTKSVQLPDEIKSVKHLEFVSQPFDGGSNKILAILSGKGVIHFYDMEMFKVVSKLVTIHEISKFYTSNDGKHICCILKSGDINIYILKNYLVPLSRQSSVAKPKKKASKTSNFASTPILLTGSSSVKVQIQQLLEIEKLKKILKEYGAYPDLHRQKIWSQVLNLPNNALQYNVINNNSSKTSFDNIDKSYPLINKVALKNLKKLLINLCTWCPLFSHVTYLPMFAFPFVRVFQNEPVFCFECLATVVINWCQHWFEYFPLPPMNILAIIENAFLEHDIELLRHFSKFGITSQMYGWSLLETAFSEVLSSDSWLIFWDHVLSNEPAFLILAVIAYNMIQRKTLLCLKTQEEFEFFYHNQNPINFKLFITKTYTLLERTSDQNHPRQYLYAFKSLGTESYPMFTQYPKAILEVEKKEVDALNVEKDIIIMEKEKIEKIKLMQQEELEALKRREEEEERLRILESMCRNKVKEEYYRIQNERKKLAQLRREMTAEESVFHGITQNKILASSMRNKQTAIEELLFNIDKNRGSNEVEVINAETEILRHYSDLLKHRIQIEDLIDAHGYSDDEKLKFQLREQQKQLVKDITKIQNEVSSRKHLKHLSIATGIAAMDSLILKIEKELENQTAGFTYKDGTTDEKISKLKTESSELESRVKDLMALISHHKTLEVSKFTNPAKFTKKSRSLNHLNEKLVAVTEYNEETNTESEVPAPVERWNSALPSPVINN